MVMEKKSIPVPLMRLLGIVMLLIISACRSQIVSLDEHASSWIGRSIEDKRVILNRPTSYASGVGWQETLSQIPNGNFILIEPVRKGCLVYWEADKNRIIVAYRTEGSECY
jgi:hypothetical protein